MMNESADLPRRSVSDPLYPTLEHGESTPGVGRWVFSY